MLQSNSASGNSGPGPRPQRPDVSPESGGPADPGPVDQNPYDPRTIAANERKRKKAQQQYGKIGGSPADEAAKKGGKEAKNHKQGDGLKIESDKNKRKKVSDQLVDTERSKPAVDKERRTHPKQPGGGFFAQWKDHVCSDPLYNSGVALVTGGAGWYLGGPVAAAVTAVGGSLAEFQLHGRWTE